MIKTTIIAYNFGTSHLSPPMIERDKEKGIKIFCFVRMLMNESCFGNCWQNGKLISICYFKIKLKSIKVYDFNQLV